MIQAPLTKEDFCTAIDTIKNYWDKLKIVEDSFSFDLQEGPLVDIVDQYVDTLCLIMKDKPDISNTTLINYFCFGKDFGRKYEEDNVLVEGKEFPFYNSEDLYDLLIYLYWKEN